MTTILLVDDEPMIIKSLTRLLTRQSWQVLGFTDPRKALDEVANRAVDLVICDYRMPAMDGIEFLDHFRRQHPDTPRIILSGHADMQGVLKAVNQSEVYRFVLKPWDDEELLHTLKTALRFNELIRENARLAELVRAQRNKLKRQQTELNRLERDSPGITRIQLDDEGMIDLSDEAGDIN